ncbi:MAG: hypothetical protein IIC66_11285 [candidate division Zixibacteria bacterium]|nr:hypothetical protein [candidate division Zixibacteria bacterium]
MEAKIDIEEPTISDAKLILHGVAKYFAKFHEVEYTEKAIDAAVVLSAKHIHDNRLPDKLF